MSVGAHSKGELRVVGLSAIDTDCKRTLNCESANSVTTALLSLNHVLTHCLVEEVSCAAASFCS